MPERRWPIAPVEAALIERMGVFDYNNNPDGYSYARAADLLNMRLPASRKKPLSGETFGRRAREGTISEFEANWFAAALGEHPSFLWPSWFDADLDEDIEDLVEAVPG